MNILSTVLTFVWCSLYRTLAEESDPCEIVMNAFPPNPNTGCCGVDRFSSIGVFEGKLKHEAHILDYPWLALIEYEQDGKFKTPSGGALISGKYVLTASHCVVGVHEIGTPENIILGEYDTNHEGNDCYVYENGDRFCDFGTVRIPIEKIISHPDYQNNVREHPNDIALIRMKEIAPYTLFIRPICLPTIDLPVKEGVVTFNKASWGRFTPNEKSIVKSQVVLYSISLDECEAAFVTPLSKITLTKNQICTSATKSIDFCKGDAGFPLTYFNFNVELPYRSELAGIVSFGSRFCNKAVPTVYTKVYEYRAWILDTIID